MAVVFLRDRVDVSGSLAEGRGYLRKERRMVRADTVKISDDKSENSTVTIAHSLSVAKPPRRSSAAHEWVHKVPAFRGAPGGMPGQKR